jgi:conjugative transfer signal peptidase TraF
MIKSSRWWWIGILAMCSLVLAHPRASRTRVVYNPTASAPRGWYLIAPATEFKVNDFVLAQLPEGARRLASERRYLPSNVPLLKRIGARSPQFVCVRGRSLWIDGALAATALTHDGRGRDLAVWTGCRVLNPDELLLLSHENAASFDSRYFGPIHSINVIGKASPVWTW